METFFITFALGGPLRKQYAKLTAVSELQARVWAKEHFPRDWAFIYRPEEFDGQAKRFNLHLCFEETLHP